MSEASRRKDTKRKYLSAQIDPRPFPAETLANTLVSMNDTELTAKERAFWDARSGGDVNPAAVAVGAVVAVGGS